ncbi:MAG: hypothetical protein IPN13_17920 [Bacteroidetes bacterium]|nr:hypothetical protein [Bacteroidota bacterium]
MWSDGALSQTINVTLAGTYTVTVSDASGCINSDDVVITVTPPPFLELGPNQTICAGTAVVLDAGAGNFNYLWNDGSTNQLYRLPLPVFIQLPLPTFLPVVKQPIMFLLL